MNIVELNNLVRKISLACPLVNSYYNESVYECWNTKEVKYGSVVMDVTNVSTNTAISTYQCLFYYGDRLTEAKTNKNAIRTDAITVLDSIISKLYEQDGVSITFSNNYTLFEQKFEDELCGAYITVDVQVMGDGMCGFDIEVGSDFEVVQLHETIKENGLYEWKSGKDKYYDQVVIDVDVPKGLDVDFSVIYDDEIIDSITQKMNGDIAYTKSVECPVPYTDLDEYYYGSRELVYAPLYNTDGSIFGTNCTTMSHLFYKCTLLQYVPKINTSSVTNMKNMFYGCSNLTSIPQLDTSSVTDMYGMFDACPNLTSIPQLDTSNVTNMSYMFYGCSSLTEIPLLDTSSVTSMNYMFDACSNLTSIPQLDTSNVINMNQMFYNCSQLKTIPQLDTSKVKTMTQTFSQCTNLKSIPLLDLSSLYGFSNLFSGTNKLVDLGGFKDLGKGFTSTSISATNTMNLSYNNQLTHESLMNVIYNLYDLNLNGKVGGLKLGTTNLNKLTSDEISIATNKGWTVS